MRTYANFLTTLPSGCLQALSSLLKILSLAACAGGTSPEAVRGPGRIDQLRLSPSEGESPVIQTAPWTVVSHFSVIPTPPTDIATSPEALSTTINHDHSHDEMDGDEGEVR